MPCGCEQAQTRTLPMTSGDWAEVYESPFRVETDGDAQGFQTYSEAAAYKKLHGGRVRARGS